MRACVSVCEHSLACAFVSQYYCDYVCACDINGYVSVHPVVCVSVFAFVCACACVNANVLVGGGRGVICLFVIPCYCVCATSLCKLRV